MAVDNPVSDTSRGIQHDPSFDYPDSVKIQVLWMDGNGRPLVRSEVISSDQFFGRGAYGAPIEGAHLINTIERMRRLGPPKIERKGKKK